MSFPVHPYKTRLYSVALCSIILLKQSDFSISVDLVMATPPVPKTRLARMAASQGPSSPAIALTRQETPKKLRFSMPGRGETPTPTEEIDEETPPPSAEKQGLHGDDGSPTPRPPLRAMELDDSVEPDSSPRLDR